VNLCRFETNRLGLIENGRFYDVTPALDMLPPRAWPFPQHDVLIEHLDEIVAHIRNAPLPVQSKAVEDVWHRISRIAEFTGGDC
jgi:hypothetical protein